MVLIVDVVDSVLQKFLSNCEKNDLYDVIATEASLWLLFEVLTTIGEEDNCNSLVEIR